MSDLHAWDAANDLYYVEVTFLDGSVYPGGQSAFRKECQFRIALPFNSNDPEFDAGGDPSFPGIVSGNYNVTDLIPVYEGATPVFGLEP